MPKRNSHHIHRQHIVAPKPPSRFLWIMEAVLISIGIFAVISVLIIVYLAFTNHRRAQDAINSLTGVTFTEKSENLYKTIKSDLGFELSINTNLQKAEATKTNDELVQGEGVFTQSKFKSVSVYSNSSGNPSNFDESARSKSTYFKIESNNDANFFNQLKIQYGLNYQDQELVEKYYQPIGSITKTYDLATKEEVTIGDVKYLKLVWDITNNDLLKYKTRQTDYITIQNNRPYKITIYQNAGYEPRDAPNFIGLISTVKYFKSLAKTSINQSTHSSPKSVFLPAITAYAASRLISKDPAIQVVAKNMPSVVKVTTVYCIDFNLILNQVSQPINSGCAGGTGSGFIISPDGYVATNGHVVKFTPLDVLIDSIYLENKQVTRAYLDFLVRTGVITSSTADYYYAQSIAGNQKSQDDIVASLDLLPDQTTTKATMEKGYYAVQLSNQAVKFDREDLKNFNYGETIARADLIDLNYDPYANVAKEGFKSSDVAILKLDGVKQYPFLTLGSIDGLSSGSPLTVIGFPGLAENEIVNTNESIPTATEGKVSSIRTANGTNNKLIQSDVSIAHGNSGGPAFNASGEVVGIATYGIEEQGAKVNYMRDIADLKSLISKNNITIPKSTTGSEKLWQDGLSKYTKAYYSSAIADFKKVKQIYPQNRLVDEFIAKAETAKSEGKEAIAPEVYTTVVVVFVVVILIPGVVLFFVVRHHRKRKAIHQEYMSQNKPVASNQIPSQTPLTPQNTAQKSTVRTNMIDHAPAQDGAVIQPKDTTIDQ